MPSARVELDRDELVLIVRALENEIAFALRHRVTAREDIELSRKLKAILRDGCMSWGGVPVIADEEMEDDVIELRVDGQAEPVRIPVPASAHYECRCDEGAPHEYPCPLANPVGDY